MNTSSENTSRATVLFVDDETAILSSLKRLMNESHNECFYANSGDEALSMLEEMSIDIVVSDMRMPNMNGAELLATVAQLYPETVRLVLSGYSDGNMVMSAINEGRIWGYINKPWDDEQLLMTLEQAIFTQQVVAERALLRRTLDYYELNSKDKFCGFVGSSVPMQFVYSAIERAAPSSASVFITGPSGTGKEVTAKALHDLSKRKDKCFLALNCAAIPSELMESEIFGHVKGAFSGAVGNRDGAAKRADGGTLFLDELSEMDINLQAKLLRFIQTGQFQAIGSNKVEYADIRFVCATNREPIQAIDDKKLREDLYYRLNVISIDLPPLVEREGDAFLLAQHFLRHFSEAEDKPVVGFSKEAEAMIRDYDWPGNVRQLQNCIHSAVVMARGALIDKEDISSMLTRGSMTEKPKLEPVNRNSDSGPRKEPVDDSLQTPNQIRPLADIERAAIEHAIAVCGKNVVKAAGHLEVSPSTLYRKIQSWAD